MLLLLALACPALGGAKPDAPSAPPARWRGVLTAQGFAFQLLLKAQKADDGATTGRALLWFGLSEDQAIAAAPIWHSQHRVLSEVIGSLKKSLGQLGRGNCPA